MKLRLPRLRSALPPDIQIQAEITTCRERERLLLEAIDENRREAVSLKARLGNTRRRLLLLP